MKSRRKKFANRAIRRTLVLLMLAVTAGLGASWIAGSIMTRGHQTVVASAEQPAQDLKFLTKDGVTIAATFTPGHDDHSPAVLLLHGLGASRQAMAANAAWLASLGYAALAIDFRGHGQSDITTRTFGLREALEARVAFDWLKHRQKGAPTAVIGISLGGAASLIGEAGPLPADALILQAVYPDVRRAIRNRIASRLPDLLGYGLEPLLSFQAPFRFGMWPSRLSPLDALAKYRGPVLIVGGQQDRSTPSVESREMFAAVRGNRELWLVPSGDHAEICDLADVAYRERIKAFLEEAMRTPS